MTINKKEFSISLKFKLHHDHGTAPEFFAVLNGTPLQVDGNIASGRAIFGSNIISVNFTNKVMHHATLALEIEKFVVEDIDLTHNIKSENVYITTAGVQEHTHGYMHKNGVLTFEFLCPAFYHLRNKSLLTERQ